MRTVVSSATQFVREIAGMMSRCTCFDCRASVSGKSVNNSTPHARQALRCARWNRRCEVMSCNKSVCHLFEQTFECYAEQHYRWAREAMLEAFVRINKQRNCVIRHVRAPDTNSLNESRQQRMRICRSEQACTGPRHVKVLR